MCWGEREINIKGVLRTRLEYHLTPPTISYCTRKGGAISTVNNKLTKYEQETITNFNKAEDKASIFTYSKKWQRHLERLGFKPVMDNGFGGKEYLVPKNMIRMPQKKRRCSEESRKTLTGRFSRTTF